MSSSPTTHTGQKRSETISQTETDEESERERERGELTGVRPQVDVYVSCHETIHIRELQLRLQSVRPCETKKSTHQNKLFTRSTVCFITEPKRSYQTSVRADSAL